MKRLLFTFYLIVITITIKAAKADPTPFTIIQPDGTKLTLVLQTTSNPCGFIYNYCIGAPD